VTNIYKKKIWGHKKVVWTIFSKIFFLCVTQKKICNKNVKGQEGEM